MLDLSRELRWGRVEENFGEDPFLCVASHSARVSCIECECIVGYDDQDGRDGPRVRLGAPVRPPAQHERDGDSADGRDVQALRCIRESAGRPVSCFIIS